MPRCPQCNKDLARFTSRCPTCHADLGLLVDYVQHLEDGLKDADNLTRSGELGQAVWAYLEVLETDPDNPVARRQVGQVATAVRQFDQTAPARRWAAGLQPYLDGVLPRWMGIGLLAALFLIVFVLGFFLGSMAGGSGDDRPPQFNEPDRNMGKSLNK